MYVMIKDLFFLCAQYDYCCESKQWIKARGYAEEVQRQLERMDAERMRWGRFSMRVGAYEHYVFEAQLFLPEEMDYAA